MLREQIKQDIAKAIKQLTVNSLQFTEKEIEVTRTSNPKFGDFATNLPLKIASSVIARNEVTKQSERKIAASSEYSTRNDGENFQSPMEIANILADSLKNLPYIEKLQAVNPGFVNFSIKDSVWQEQVKEVLESGEEFGSNKTGENQKAQVEFVSANPTGPLTLGNGRGGFMGDTIANLLEKCGYEVEREYYVNDIGMQIGEHLRNSILGKGPYKGRHIDDLAKRMDQEEKNGNLWSPGIGKKAAEIILDEYIKKTIEKMQINHGKGFNEYFLESSLYADDIVAKKRKLTVLNKLKSDNLIYEGEGGATFFRTTKFGDDKDRVIFKKDTVPTYFFSDILHKAFIMGKKFDKLVIFLGADHHGYQARMQAAMEAFGYKGKLSIIIVQLVRLLSKGKEVRMSKRSGTYVTLDELIEKVGLDAARFFFIAYAPNTHMDFDLELAKKRSNDNPVYYVQYAHARICSILAKSNAKRLTTNANYQLLTTNYELNLIKQISRFPELILDISKNFAVNQLTVYAMELADTFHKFYENCRVLPSEASLTSEALAKEAAKDGDRVSNELSSARLALVEATKVTLGNTFRLLGISAPEKM